MVNSKILLTCLYLSIVLSILAPATGRAEIRVVAVGDSITAGYPYLQDNGNGCSSCPQEGFEIQLKAKLDASGKPSTVYNYGNPGDSTFGMLSRIEQILDQMNPDVVLLLGGTNDIAFFSPGTIASNLAAMVDKVRAHKGKPIIGTLTPDSIPANSFKDIPTYNRHIITMANSRGVSIADHYSATVGGWENLTTDGLHLNSTGNLILAHNWFKAFFLDTDNIDNDGDGSTENQGDCDDTDSSVFPFALDLCGDGIDQDCDGEDERCLSIPPFLMLLLDEN